jgi:hypothetical protein
MSITLEIVFHGLENFTCPSPLTDATSSLFFNKGSQILIRNSDQYGTVASPTLSHSAKRVMFLKSHLNPT